MWWPFRSTPEPPCDWELIDKTVLPSAYEQLSAGDAYCAEKWLFRTTVVLTFKCRLSGKVKTITERNP